MSAQTRITGAPAPGAPVLPDPPDVSMYRTLHNADMGYQTHNQGLACSDRWIGMIAECHTVLEVGCGNGLLCGNLARLGKSVVGVDLVPGPYDRAGYTFQACQITEQPLPDGFDVTLCFDVLEHIPEDKVDSALANIGQSAQAFVLSIAGYGNPPIHPTVKSPGWWLNKLLNHMPGRSWLCEVFERYEDRPSPVYLFLGNTPNE